MPPSLLTTSRSGSVEETNREHVDEQAVERRDDRYAHGRLRSCETEIARPASANLNPFPWPTPPSASHVDYNLYSAKENVGNK